MQDEDAQWRDQPPITRTSSTYKRVGSKSLCSRLRHRVAILGGRLPLLHSSPIRIASAARSLDAGCVVARKLSDIPRVASKCVTRLPDALLSISITNEPEMPRTRLITESPATTTLVYTVHRTCARSFEDWIFCYGFTHDSVCKVYACMAGCMIMAGAWQAGMPHGTENQPFHSTI